MSENDCNVDDVLCQLEVLKGLKTIESAVGKEGFAGKFPEFDGLGEKIKESIASSQVNLREALAKCGNDDLLKETIEGLDTIPVIPAKINDEEVLREGAGEE